MGQNEETLSTHPARSETKKVTDKEPTRPVRNTRTWMKTTSYGKTKQHLFVGLLLGVIVLSTQAQALSIEQPGPPICCSAYDAQCESCKQGLSEEEYCRKNPSVPGCKKYLIGGGSKPPICCSAYDSQCESCNPGLSEEEYCKKNPSTSGCEKYNCCKAFTADCQSCAAGLSEEEYCKKNPSTGGCEKYNCCRANNAKCNSCKEGISEEEYCKKSLPSVPPGCKREGCCKAFTARCRACHRGESVEAFCKNRPKVPGCERNFRDCKKDPSASGCKWFSCCKKFTSKCVACSKGISEEDFCRRSPNFKGCEKLG